MSTTVNQHGATSADHVASGAVIQVRCSDLAHVQVWSTSQACPCSPKHTALPEQVFLEPEGRDTPELYVQGFSTGLPERLQLALLRTLPGAPHYHLNT